MMDQKINQDLALLISKNGKHFIERESIHNFFKATAFIITLIKPPTHINKN